MQTHKEHKEWVPGDPNNAIGYWQEPAPNEAVLHVLSQPVETEDNHDGRSKWLWLRLPDGDLVLACYPQGDTYFATEHWRTI